MSFSPVPSFVAQDTPGPYTNEELGFMWLDWVAELSADSIRNYELVLMVRDGLTLPDSVNAWAKLTRFRENQGITGWPQGPNACFKQINWFYHHDKLEGPFFWLEPDCIPVVPDWLDLIADEYKRGGKPFMGAIVEPDSHLGRIGRVPRHMTGNAIYPDKPYKLAPKIMEATNTCWDVLAASQILPQCHPTTLIQHDWRRPEIQNRQELSKILLPNTALFHSDKYGAIPRILGSDKAPPPPPPIDMPITEYAASRGVPVENAPPVTSTLESKRAPPIQSRVRRSPNTWSPTTSLTMAIAPSTGNLSAAKRVRSISRRPHAGLSL
jgi:hypothetical protein